MNKNDFYEFFYTFAIYPKMHEFLCETGIWILQLDSFMFFIFFHLIFPHIKFLSFTTEYTLQFYIKYSDLNRDFDAESKKWSLVYLFLNCKVKPRISAKIRTLNDSILSFSQFVTQWVKCFTYKSYQFRRMKVCAIFRH